MIMSMHYGLYNGDYHVDGTKSSSLKPCETEFLWVSTPRRKNLISHLPLVVTAEHTPSVHMRLLGVLINEMLSFEAHINYMICCYHYQLRRIKMICLTIYH